MQQDEDTQQEFQATLDSWYHRNPDRPVVIMVAGKTGAGKSTLLNNILGTEEAEEYFSGRSGTTDVKVHEGVCRNVKFKIIDAPGLHALGHSDKDLLTTISDMSKVTGGNLDILLYCVSLVQKTEETDVKIIKSLTKAFGDKIWSNTVLVFTFANFAEQMKNDKKVTSAQYLQEHVDQFKLALVKAGVPVDELSVEPYSSTDPSRLEINSTIIGIPAGLSDDQTLRFCDGKQWFPILITEIVRKCEVEAIAGLLNLRGITVPILIHTAAAVSAASAGAMLALVPSGAGRVGGATAMTIGAALEYQDNMDWNDLIFLLRLRWQRFRS